MAYLTGYQYYENNGNVPEDENWGSYQYVSLKDIVNNFMLMYQGNHELINNIDRNKVTFFAKRAIQELNYDALKETKILQLDVCDNLRFVLPPDYVNWVRISMFKEGVLLPLTENIQTNWAKSYLQDNNCRILFDNKGDILLPSDYSSLVDKYRIDKLTPSIYLNEGSPYYGVEGFCCDGDWYFEYPIGARYGLNTETANQNPTFKIDKAGGVINFSSGVAGESIVLEYVSDGMHEYEYVSDENGGYRVIPNDDKVGVNKLFEEYVYAHIKYMILSNKLGVQEYIVQRSRKEKSALLRNSKLRLSNIHPGRLLMNLRGQQKIIK